MKILLLLTATLGVLSTAQPAFRSGVDVVQVDVAVTDHGKPVMGLQAGDFEVTDNGVAQEVRSAILTDAPLDLTMVLDISHSVSGARLAALVTAASQLLDRLHPSDRISLVTFSHNVKRVLPLGRDTNGVRRALAGMQGGGSTSVRDALYLALQTSPPSGVRPLVILFSDGVDTASWLTEREVIDVARSAGTVVHTIVMETGSFYVRLAEATGGRSWHADDDGRLPRLFAAALEEMRTRYLLAYSPRGRGTAGWHPIRVRVKGHPGTVTARPGYVVIGATGQKH